jgi:hypothetical protein
VIRGMAPGHQSTAPTACGLYQRLQKSQAGTFFRSPHTPDIEFDHFKSSQSITSMDKKSIFE